MTTPLPLLTGTELLVTLFAFVTVLGDAWVLFAGLTVLYWVGPRIDDTLRPVAATVIALATLALAVVLAVKSYTALSRPTAMPIDPATLPRGLASFVAGELESTGFTFPSGHATGATAVYGGLAALLTVGRRRLRYTVAGSVIVLVSASRVILGVHYPRDIVAGMVLGVVLVAVGSYLARNGESLQADRVFLLAALVSVGGIIVTAAAGLTEDLRHAVIGFGISVGGGILWERLTDRLCDAPPVSIPGGIAGLTVTGVLLLGAYAGLFGLLGAAVGSIAGIACLLGLPLAEQWRKKRS